MEPDAFSRPHTLVVGSRPIWFRRFDDGSGYAINLDHPTGVQYLVKSAADRLTEILSYCSNPLVASKADSFLDTQSLIDRQIVLKLLDPLGRLKGFRSSEVPDFRASIKDQVSVWFHISNSCNLACSYCYIPGLKKAVTVPKDGTIPSDHLLRKIIASLFELARDNGFRSLRIRFAGGEPSLVPELLELACKEALLLSSRTSIPVTFSILTNATLVTSQFLHILTKFKFSGISISIDGDCASHDSYRFKLEKLAGKATRVGTWKGIFENIRLLGEHGIRPYVLTTVTEKNYQSLGELVDACLEHKVGFRLSPVRDDRTSRLPGIQEAILSVLESIYEGLPERLPMSRPIQNYANFAEWAPHVKKSVACGTCRSSFALNQNGEVSTCQMRLETTYGSIQTEELGQIFRRMAEHPDNWRFVASSKARGGCSVCLWRTTCAGGCPEHTKLSHDTYDAPSPWCKLYGDFLPVYFRAIAKQMKRFVDSNLNESAPKLVEV